MIKSDIIIKSPQETTKQNNSKTLVNKRIWVNMNIDNWTVKQPWKFFKNYSIKRIVFKKLRTSFKTVNIANLWFTLLNLLSIFDGAQRNGYINKQIS